MNLRKGIFSLFLLLATFALHAQQTTVFTEATLAHKRGVDFFNQNLYGLTQKEFRSAINYLRPANEPEWKALKTDAELYQAKCAVRLGQPEAEKLVLDTIQVKQAKKLMEGADQSLMRMIRDTYKWLICPLEEFVNGKPILNWEAVSVSTTAPNCKFCPALIEDS